MPSPNPSSPYGGSQTSEVYSPSSIQAPQSPDGSISGPGSPYSLPADTPPPAYMPPEGDKAESMDTRPSTTTSLHPSLHHGNAWHGLLHWRFEKRFCDQLGLLIFSFPNVLKETDKMFLTHVSA